MQRVSVRSLRYDGTPRHRLDANLLSAEAGVLRIRIDAGTPCETPGGVIREVATATQLLFADRWYNINHFHSVVAPYRNLWYVNLAMPATFDGNEIRWIDLDLDVMCDVEHGVLMKDEAPYAARVASGYYPKEIAENVEQARAEIISLARRAAFPFDRERQIGGDALPDASIQPLTSNL
jgi:hypothetical protein